MNDGRLVLMPHGPPVHAESRERCLELVMRCGGDLGRIFDGSDRSMDDFAKYVAGIGDLVNGRKIPLVVLTELEPLPAAIVEVRRVLEAHLAILERAPWIIYADPFVDASCLEGLQRTGDMDGPALHAPLWAGPDGLNYLVISPLMHAPVTCLLPERVRLVEHCFTPRSTRRPDASPELSRHAK